METASYTYDEFGILTSVTDAKGTITYVREGKKFVGYDYGSNSYRYTLNDYGDITGISYNGETAVTYSNGRSLTDTITYANGQREEYEYGANGLLLSNNYYSGSQAQASYNYTYDSYGDLKKVEFEDITKSYSYTTNTEKTIVEGGNYRHEMTKFYDSNGRYIRTTYGYISTPQDINTPLVSIGDSSSVQYSSELLGMISAEQNGAITTVYTYNSDNTVSSITRSISGVVYETHSYTYDDAKRIATVTQNGEDTYYYGYDAMGNITSIIKDGATYRSYSYDSSGRLTSGVSYDSDNNITSSEYEYENGRLVEYDGKAISYDSLGNMTSYNGNSYIWEQGTKLARIMINQDRIAIIYDYSYDENGLRVKKQRLLGLVNSTTRYYYDGTRVIAEDKDGILTRYYYDSTGVIGMFYNGSDYYFTKNLFGDIIKVVKSDGTVVAQYSYDTWGKCTVETNVDGMADKNPFRYRGYYYDVESGLYYLQTRYYSPEFKRFISPDSYDLLPTLAEAGDLNLYAYCSNNPVMYTDPTGELALWAVVLLGIFVSGIITGLTNVVTMATDETFVGAFLGGFVEGAISATVLAAGLALATIPGGGIVAAIAGGATAVAGGFFAGRYGNALGQYISYGNVDWGVANINGALSALSNLAAFCGFYANVDILSTANKIGVRFLENVSLSSVSVGVTSYLTSLPKFVSNANRNEERIKNQKGKYLWEYLFA